MARTHSLLIALTPLLMAVALVGLADIPPLSAWLLPQACSTDSDCPQGQICMGSPFNYCVAAECITNADCSGQHAGYICREYYCVPCTPPRLGSNFKCPADQYCQLDGTCITLKSADQPCNNGKECLSQGCIPGVLPGITPGKYTGHCGCSSSFPCPSGRVCLGDYCMMPDTPSVEEPLFAKRGLIDAATVVVQEAQESAAVAQAAVGEAQTNVDEALGAVAEAKGQYTEAKQEYAANKKDATLKAAYSETKDAYVAAKADLQSAKTERTEAKQTLKAEKSTLKSAQKALTRLQKSK